MFFDWTYVVLVMPAVLLAFWASARVNRTFQKYQNQHSLRGITGAEAARRVLDANGLSQVAVERVSGNLTDHFDPKANVVRLSDGVHDSTSTAAIGVACHEVGHAIQHAVGYVPARVRLAIVPITQFGSRLALPLVLIGLLLGGLAEQWIVVAYIGIGCFALSTLFQLVTLPTEYNASRRAMETIREHQMLTEEEMAGTRRVLSAAALTYVAALAVSLMQLLRLMIIIGGRRRRD